MKIHARGKPFLAGVGPDKIGVNWDKVAKRTVGFSGADLENMLNEAAIQAARGNKKEIDMKIRGHGDIYGIMQHGYKTFKIADLSNLGLIEKAKEAAQEIYKEIDLYPKLKEKLAKSHGKMVEMN